MAGHKSFDVIRNRLTTGQKAEVAKGVREDIQEMLLKELRKLAGLTQEESAAAMGISQPALSQLEAQDDMHISTLQRIVKALGGKLDIIVELPDVKVSISQFKQSA